MYDLKIIQHPYIPEDVIMAHYAETMFLDEKQHKLNENTFARAFSEVNNLKYKNGIFYTRYGKANEEMLARDIWQSVADMGVASNVGNTVEKLLKAVKLCATVEDLTPDENIIPFQNGDLHLREWEFHDNQFSATPYRFPVALRYEGLIYTPNFDKWLKDLFEEDDRKTVRQYLGYCLVPHTKAQKALFLVGEGGVGKSVLGVILNALLGKAMISVSNSQEFINDKFKLPELENRLVLYDDDLDSAALSKTGLYKKLITNTLDITADRKYGQPFAFRPQVKIISCCNEMLSSMYDNTSGFFRRLLPLKTRPKSPDFSPDNNFYDKVAREAEGILQWCLGGLQELYQNGWQLHVSDRTADYLQQKSDMDNHLPLFFESEFIHDSLGAVSTKDIMTVYEKWCAAEGFKPYAPRTVQTWFGDNAEKLNIEYSKTVLNKDNSKSRGFRGIILRNPPGTYREGMIRL